MQELIYLTFHGIGERPHSIGPGEERVWVGVDLFEAALDLIAALRAEGHDDVRITFDDGNISDYAIALPRLLERRLPATFFIISDRVGNNGFLGPTHLREMCSRGMTIGTHGLHHIDWRQADDNDLRAELVGARKQISEMLGKPVDEAAIPFGSYDRRVLRWLCDTGYRHAYTSDGGRTRDGEWLVPRWSVHRSDDLASIRHLIERRFSFSERLSFAIKGFVKRWR